MQGKLVVHCAEQRSREITRLAMQCKRLALLLLCFICVSRDSMFVSKKAMIKSAKEYKGPSSYLV